MRGQMPWMPAEGGADPAAARPLGAVTTPNLPCPPPCRSRAAEPVRPSPLVGPQGGGRGLRTVRTTSPTMLRTAAAEKGVGVPSGVGGLGASRPEVAQGPLWSRWSRAVSPRAAPAPPPRARSHPRSPPRSRPRPPGGWGRGHSWGWGGRSPGPRAGPGVPPGAGLGEAPRGGAGWCRRRGGPAWVGGGTPGRLPGQGRGLTLGAGSPGAAARVGGGVWVDGRRAAAWRPLSFPFEQTSATEQELSFGVDKQLWGNW